MALFKIVQGIISTIMNAAGFGSATQTVLPQEVVTAVEDCGFLRASPYGRSRSLEGCSLRCCRSL